MSYGKMIEVKDKHGVPIIVMEHLVWVEDGDTTHSGHHFMHLKLCIEYSTVMFAMKL